MNLNAPLFPSGDAIRVEKAPLLRGVDTPFNRHLTENRRNADGTLAVLMIVFALFCFIWAPVMLRRCRGQNNTTTDDVNDLARFEAEARAVRATLQRMSMIGNNNVVEESTSSDRRDPHLENRREFLDSALLTKKIVFQSELDEEHGKVDDREEDVKEDTDITESEPSTSGDRKPPRRQKSNVIVLMNTIKHKKDAAATTPQGEEDDNESDKKAEKEEKDDNNESDKKEEKGDDEESTDNIPQDSPKSQQSEDSQLEPCSICLAEYNDGDEICWSHNENCNHFFHKACIQEWLLTHEDCPCCRQDFICLWGDAATANNTQRPRRTFARSQATSSLDWAEELAEEIQERILQRQRELQTELQLRDRQQRMLQLQQQLYSLSSPTLVSTARRQPARNTVISVDDMAAGFLLYRHFPHHFASDARRVRERSNALNGGDDVEVAHFGMSHRQQPWQTYRPDMPMVPVTPGTSIFELVDRSSRRRAHPQPLPRFFSTTALDTSNRFIASARSRANASANIRSSSQSRARANSEDNETEADA